MFRFHARLRGLQALRTPWFMLHVQFLIFPMQLMLLGL